MSSRDYLQELIQKERVAILKRDGWRCTVIDDPLKRAHNQAFGRGATELAGKVQSLREREGPRRCTTTGSEVDVVDGRTMCPRHAEEHRRGTEGETNVDCS